MLLSCPGESNNTFTKCGKARESPASVVGPVRGGRGGLGRKMEKDFAKFSDLCFTKCNGQEGRREQGG